MAANSYLAAVAQATALEFAAKAPAATTPVMQRWALPFACHFAPLHNEEAYDAAFGIILAQSAAGKEPLRYEGCCRAP